MQRQLTCSACDFQCTSCAITTYNCQSCKRGYILVGTSCVCPVGSFMTHALCQACSYKCLTCTNTTEFCQSCKAPFARN